MAAIIDRNHGFKSLAQLPRCRLQSYSHLDPSMHDSTHNITHTSNVTTTLHKSYSTPCLSLATNAKQEVESPNPRIEIVSGQKAPKVHDLVAEVAIALASGVKPTPVPSGLGGAYYMQSRKEGNSNNTIAVVKPADEEPLAFNNPKGFAGRMLGQPGMKRSIRVGETGLRELAAYLLDHGGFAGVPPSALVKICHVTFNVNVNMELASNPPFKITSIQRYVEHETDAGDLGPSRFSVCSVHRIGILDIRLLNLDRHAGNMLVKNFNGNHVAGKAELVPIDHGFCLPESLDDPYFEWLHWPQSSIPFSELEADYISSLDPFKDAELLRTELPSIRECSVRVFILCTIFLKRATAAGLSLADIGEMMTRDFIGGEESWSILENICVNAKANLDMEILSNGSDENKEFDEMFAFDKVFEDSLNQDQDVSTLSADGKPTKMMRYSSEGARGKLIDPRLTRLVQESGIKDGCGPAGISIPRSASFAAHSKNPDTGVCVSFEEMKEDEWSSFLEYYEELLPEAFLQKQSTSMLKQRLGYSCEF
ncbi:putative 1-phosphatidylinositol 4-kinase [Helianthus annuus]|uniref:1-phosphatidylinositol 4-kinase n=1 Tax=Helianthus annuus TaxID=4232 RepID=A0A251UIU1_HELAN|nr:phosphatidylinositol 4-kinase gamma 1 [Helianthus annuus]KAF5802380.1 putative 1-phosphatidylinositol 4-kinase [Helianthus annuus]KAJ0560519.1 putative 1-phosphatidylinositol 4-kinase [Helianthus annuus]KAJ0566883.1 putative 1-phosphatidylinositol 4-kinase [Helianthus annuus]KAJ0573548.1 putative 1-phosphatidylinositol 4-kinase [Helianthus annuus]KAJ0737909.1 putative 1-phosphatidylinositol 4-kinase [Helianthus annuus]